MYIMGIMYHLEATQKPVSGLIFDISSEYIVLAIQANLYCYHPAYYHGFCRVISSRVLFLSWSSFGISSFGLLIPFLVLLISFSTFSSSRRSWAIL